MPWNTEQNIWKRRTPHGVRGLKSRRHEDEQRRTTSHPSWGARIEIITVSEIAEAASRTPHGVRGLK